MMFITSIPIETFYRNSSAYRLPIAGEAMLLNQGVIFKDHEVYKANSNDINHACAGQLMNKVEKGEGAVINYYGEIYILVEESDFVRLDGN